MSVSTLKILNVALKLPTLTFPPMEHSDTLRHVYNFNLEQIGSYLKEPIKGDAINAKEDTCLGFLQCYTDILKLAPGDFNPLDDSSFYRQDRGWFAHRAHMTLNDIAQTSLGQKTLPPSCAKKVRLMAGLGFSPSS